MCEEVEDALNDVPDDAPYYVYSIKLSRSDGEEYIYVGSVANGTSGLHKRILDHIRENGECSMPVELNGREVLLPKRTFITEEEYQFEDLLEVTPVYDESERHVREVERQYSYECAIEHETTNILGGK